MKWGRWEYSSPSGNTSSGSRLEFGSPFASRMKHQDRGDDCTSVPNGELRLRPALSVSAVRRSSAPDPMGTRRSSSECLKRNLF